MNLKKLEGKYIEITPTVALKLKVKGVTIKKDKATKKDVVDAAVLFQYFSEIIGGGAIKLTKLKLTDVE